MPQNRNNPEPPPTMTWPKAIPILVTAGICDLFRGFFELFWLFGPALVGAGCTLGVNSALRTTLAETTGKLVAGGCTIVAGAAGYFGSEVFVGFGDIMAMAIGLASFLLLGMWILKKNARIFKVNATGSWWFIGGFAGSVVPFVGTIPMFSVVLYKLYKTQIRIEKAAFKKWKKEQEDNRLQERDQKIAYLMQAQSAQLAPAEI